MSEIKLTPQQRLVVENTGGELLVSAAAGSGKTRVLVERLLRKIDAGADIDEFLIITYTNAAAAELRGKILDAIYERIARDPLNQRLRREAALAGRAEIETIHSFCAKLIRENSQSLDLPPDFRVADEPESRVLRANALQELLEEQYAAGDPGFLALADTMGAGRDDSALEDVILETHGKLMSHLDPEKWVEERLRDLALEGVTDAAETPWGQVIIGRARRTAAFWRESMGELVDMAASDPALNKGYGASLTATRDSIAAFEAALDEGWDSARAHANIAFPKGRISGYEDVKARRTRCKAELEKVAKLFWDSSERALRDMRAVAPAMSALLKLVLAFDRRYGAVKRRRGVIDFSDQEHMALRLLVDQGSGEPTGTAREVSRRFREIMVDEYQDVNEIQERIFSAISREGRNIFTVGDVKQSIYRFRLADPTIFLRKYRRFPDAENAEDGEPRKLILSRNFRSRAGILEAVNFVFKNLMCRELGEMEYTPREYLYPGAEYPDSPEPPVELDVLDLSSGDEETEEGKMLSEARFAARRIKELVGSMRVSDGAGGTRLLKYSDVAVLSRSVRGILPDWQAAFVLEGVPLAADQPSDFFAEQEITLTMSLLAIIDNPRQDIPLISVLRSPIFGFTSEELANIRLSDRKGDFYSALCAAAGENEKCAAFLEKLRGFRRAAPDMTANELMWHIAAETDLMAVVGAMPGGARRRENLMLLFEYAAKFESAGYRGLFGFVSHMRRLQELGSLPEGPSRSQENAVTLMSIHKSKGLEFPLVILAGLVKRFNTEDARKRLLIHPDLGPGPKYTDVERGIEYPTLARRAVAERIREESMSEELRVLYVAMTRAREKLIMLATYRDAEKDLSKLQGTPLPVPPGVSTAVSTMAEWIMMAALRRPESGAIRFGAPNVPCDTEGPAWDVRRVEVRPGGEGAAESTSHTGPRETQEIPPELAKALAFKYPYMGRVSMPSKLTATELKGTFKTQEAAEEAEPLPGPRDDHPPYVPAFMEGRRGLTPAQRGTAVHTVMQFADFEKCRTAEGAAGEIERLRALGTITGEEARAVRPEVISRFFAGPTGRLILEARDVRRELKFSLLVDSGEIPGYEPGERILLQGVVDCCVQEDGELTVIDFKTDYVTPETVAERAAFYAGQVETYALAMERILKMPVRRRILSFLTAGVDVEV